MYQEKIKAVLQQQGIKQPTLIQKQSYAAIKNGASVVALAKTGTGKTLAYALPVLEKTRPQAAASVVILLPTTELAVQVRRAISPYVKALGLRTLSLVGAGNRRRQEEKLKKRQAEILVATPGRFLDFFSSGRIKLAAVRSLIIDEADDVLEFNKREMLTSLGQNMAAGSQILLFGATASTVVMHAETEFRRRFLLLDVRPEQQSTTKHYFLRVDNQHKLDFLQRLAKLDNFRGILFFDSQASLNHFAGIFQHTKTKLSVLRNDQNKEKQAQALRELASGKVRLLFATDLAARGLDLPNLTYVVNFELPDSLTTYLHRSGRVGRMNRTGIALTLGDDHDQRDLQKMLAGVVDLQRVYFASYRLTTHRPATRLKAQKQAAVKVNHKKKHRKKRKKNKGYHPHYLKEKK